MIPPKFYHTTPRVEFFGMLICLWDISSVGNAAGHARLTSAGRCQLFRLLSSQGAAVRTKRQWPCHTGESSLSLRSRLHNEQQVNH